MYEGAMYSMRTQDVYIYIYVYWRFSLSFYRCSLYLYWTYPRDDTSGHVNDILVGESKEEINVNLETLRQKVDPHSFHFHLKEKWSRVYGI